MASSVDLGRLGHSDLVGLVEQSQALVQKHARRRQREVAQQATVMDTLHRIGGASLIAPASAAVTEFIRNRWVNKDGTPLSFGPVPLPAALGVGLAMLSIYPSAYSRQFSYAAAGQLSLLGASYGAAMGVKARLKKAETVETGYAGQYHQAPAISVGGAYEIVGADEVDAGGWTAEELDLLNVA